MRLSVIVADPTGKKWVETLKNLSSTIIKESETEVLVIAPPEEVSGEKLAEFSFKVTRLSASGSPAALFARGVEQANGQYLWFILAGADFKEEVLGKLLAVLEEKEAAGAAVPKIVNEKDDSQSTCFEKRTFRFEDYIPRGGWPTRIEGALGLGFLIPRAVVDLVGPPSAQFDSAFWGWDYCQKIRRHGFFNYYVPQAKLVYPVSLYQNEKKLKQDQKRLFNPVGWLINRLLKCKKLSPIYIAGLIILVSLVTAFLAVQILGLSLL